MKKILIAVLIFLLSKFPVNGAENKSDKEKYLSNGNYYALMSILMMGHYSIARGLTEGSVTGYRGQFFGNEFWAVKAYYESPSTDRLIMAKYIVDRNQYNFRKYKEKAELSKNTEISVILLMALFSGYSYNKYYELEKESSALSLRNFSFSFGKGEGILAYRLYF